MAREIRAQSVQYSAEIVIVLFHMLAEYGVHYAFGSIPIVTAMAASATSTPIASRSASLSIGRRADEAKDRYYG
jgi:hypothetical protein